MKMAAAHVHDTVLTALDQIAEKQGVARTVVIRRALDAYIKRFSLPVSPVERTNGRGKEHPADLTTT